MATHAASSGSLRSSGASSGVSSGRVSSGGSDPLSSFHAPPRTGTLGVGLLVAGLTVAFVWLLVGYVVTRQRAGIEHIEVPAVFWVSTFVLLVSSVMLEYSAMLAKLGAGKSESRALMMSLVLGLMFMALQVPGCFGLLGAHEDAPRPLYLLTLVIVVIHALHAAGGLVRMSMLALSGPADRPTIDRLRPMALYWHYLAIVWLVIFGVLWWA